MRKARDRVLRTDWLDVSKLVVARYYGDLFPVSRNWNRLRESFERHGYKPEYPIVARTTGDEANPFAIVCGVGRYTIAKERRMRRVPVILRPFDDDIQAEIYSIEDNLYNAAASAPISLVHAIFLARTLKARGGQYSARRIWESAGVSESTFWRAVRSLDSAVQKVLPNHPELTEMDFSRQISEIVRRDLYPGFTSLFSGEVVVHTCHKAQGRPTHKDASKAASRLRLPNRELTIHKVHDLNTSQAGTSSLQNEDQALSDKATHPIPNTRKSSKRKKSIDREVPPLLFDL